MKRNNSLLWLIWGIALLPLMTAVLAYSLRLPISEGRTNQGLLLQPVPTLAQWGGDQKAHQGHWTLILKPEGECTAVCDELLARLRAIHDALGRDANRVRVQLVEHGLPRLEEGVWIADPAGNLVLKYRTAQVGEPLLKDLKRLLKVSGLG